jgi:RimJ/RimL family protein N-acetyltransferase
MNKEVLYGSLVRVEVTSDHHELEKLYRESMFLPQMGQTSQVISPSSASLSLLIYPKGEEEAIGFISHVELDGYEGVGIAIFYSKPQRYRLDFVLEAMILYVDYIFQHGTYKVHIEVLEFNKPVLRIFKAGGLIPQARLRRHAYIAGALWDVIVFGYTQSDWQEKRDSLKSVMETDEFNFSNHKTKIARYILKNKEEK